MKAKAIKIAAALAVLGLSTFMAGRWPGRVDACCGIYLYIMSFADAPDPFAPQKGQTTVIDGVIMEEAFAGVVYTPEVDIEVSDVTLSATVSLIYWWDDTTWWYFTAEWDGKNSVGELVPGGTYTYLVTASTPDMGYDSAAGTVTVEVVQLQFDCRDEDGDEDGGWTPTKGVVMLAADGEKIKIRARAVLDDEPWGEPNLKVKFEAVPSDLIMVNGDSVADESLDAASGESAGVEVEWIQGAASAYLRAVLWDPDELEEIGEAAYLPVAGEMAEITLTADPPAVCAGTDTEVTLTATVTRPPNATFRPGPEGHVDDSNLKVVFVSGDTSVLTLSGGAEKAESIDSATGTAVTNGTASGAVTIIARPYLEEFAAYDAEYDLHIVVSEVNVARPNLWWPGRKAPEEPAVTVTGRVVAWYTSPVPLHWTATGSDPLLEPGSGENELTAESQTFEYGTSHTGEGLYGHSEVTFSACGNTAVQNLVGVEMEMQVGGTGPWIHESQWSLTLQVGQTYLFRPRMLGGDWPSAPGNWVGCEGTTGGDVTSSWPTHHEKLYQGEAMTATVSGPGMVTVQMYGAEGYTYTYGVMLLTEGYERPQREEEEEPEW